MSVNPKNGSGMVTFIVQPNGFAVFAVGIPLLGVVKGNAATADDD